MKTEIDEETLVMSVPESQREAVLRALEFERNSTEKNAEYICEVMDTLYKIKQDMKHQDSIKKQLDNVIKFAIRNNADKEITKRFFDVKDARCVCKVTNPSEMLSRLMEIFDNPQDFSSCVEFNFKHLKDLMSEDKFYPAILEDTTKTRMSLKIQDGCDNRCSYCIIWKARGKSRSAKLDFIIDQINHFSNEG